MVVDALQNVWNEATNESREAEGAIPHAERTTFLPANGWREIAPPLAHPFVTYRSPADFIHSMQNRYFSSTWVMSDETIARGVAAVQAYIDAHFADPNKPEALESNFYVQAYLPPQS